MVETRALGAPPVIILTQPVNAISRIPGEAGCRLPVCVFRVRPPSVGRRY
jgi:hypothetical protein